MPNPASSGRSLLEGANLTVPSVVALTIGRSSGSKMLTMPCFAVEVLTIRYLLSSLYLGSCQRGLNAQVYSIFFFSMTQSVKRHRERETPSPPLLWLIELDRKKKKSWLSRSSSSLLFFYVTAWPAARLIGTDRWLPPSLSGSRSLFICIYFYTPNSYVFRLRDLSWTWKE